MFKRLDQQRTAAGGWVTVQIDGQACRVPAGDSVAAALLAAGPAYTRTLPPIDPAGPIQHRAPFCLMGVCFECLMTIDGVANRRACQVRVADGMRVERQHGAGVPPNSDDDAV